MEKNYRKVFVLNVINSFRYMIICAQYFLYRVLVNNHDDKIDVEMSKMTQIPTKLLLF